MEAKRPRGSRHRLTITAKALAQASNVAFWHSSPRNGTPLQKAVNGFSGMTVSPKRPDTKTDGATAPKEGRRVAIVTAKSQASATRTPSTRPTSSQTDDAKGHANEIAAMKARIAELEAILSARRARSERIAARFAPETNKDEREENEIDAYADGQPRFEGGIHWLQGGSPGLGKKH